MKRNISDLLDACRDESVELDGGTPLSPSRIKELTMSKIKQEKSRKRRAPARVLIAAAVVAALSISALAANYVLGAGALLRDYFAAKGETLTPGQVEVMDQIGKTFESGVTSNGAAITPVAALADENVYYLRLRIEAPEGVVLPDLDGDVDGYYQLFGDREEDRMSLVPEEGVYESFGYNITRDWLTDSDPTDNVKEVVLQFSAIMGEGVGAGSDVKFNDGISKLLTIHGLWVQSPYKEYTQIFSGEFTFDIGMYYESKIISLDCEGAAWRDESYGITNCLERLELSPLSLSYRFQSTLPFNDLLSPPLGDIRIVLKDGTVFWESICQEDPDPRYDPSILRDTFVSDHEGYVSFDTPLDLTQVDYVQYGEYQFSVEVG
jgi:hypothetical protein